MAIKTTTLPSTPAPSTTDATHFTPAEKARARTARTLHLALHHPNDNYLRASSINSGTYPGLDLTAADVTRMRTIYGSCAGCVMGKMTRAPSTTQPINFSELGTKFHGDI